MSSIYRPCHNSQQKTVSFGYYTYYTWCFCLLENTYIQPAIEYDSTDGEIRCMYKSVRKTKVIRRYMEALEIHTGVPTVYCEDNASFIYVVEAQRVTPRVKHIDIPVCFLQEQFDNGPFFQNMRNLVSCRHMCVPNHVKVQ